MNESDLAQSSQDFLRLTEDWTPSGRWLWAFRSDHTVWSPGFYRLLGLEPAGAKPSYDLFLSFVHPEDRAGLADADEVLQGRTGPETSLRVIRADGTMRILLSRHTLFRESDGRPRAAIGIALDVTDRERLIQARAGERRRQAALIESARTLIFSRRVGSPHSRYPLFEKLLEPSWQELRADPLAIVVPEEREHNREIVTRGQDAGVPYGSVMTLRMAGGRREPFRCVVVPIRDERGVVVEWSGILGPVERIAASPVPAAMRESLEQQLRGHHLRAARTLLDWSMMDLARASGLSLSTVRRLEEGGESVTPRSRHGAIATLRSHGVRFVVTADGVIALALA